jgi:shikimate kinase
VSGSIALVGFMGAGKTRVGTAVACRLGLPFVDTDDLIVRAHGPVTGIFAERGEAGFREIEREVAVFELGEAARSDRVVSLGGGAVTSDDVREALRRLPHVVWLDAPPHILFLRSQSGMRPLATDEAAFQALYRRRVPLYREVADHVVRTDGRSRLKAAVEQVIEAVTE